MIKLQNVSKIYPGDIAALSDINLEIKPGEFVSIVGQSGAGKTTLAKLITAEERPTSGTLEVFGQDVGKMSRRFLPRHRRKIGVVFQDFKLLPKRTIYENVAFAMEVCDMSDEIIKKDVPHLLSLVGLASKENQFPRELSGGEQQRASLARALAHKPKILIADEPTGNLDSLMAQDIVQLLLKINHMGTTIILATHNRDIVNRARKRVIALKDGKIISDKKMGGYNI